MTIDIVHSSEHAHHLSEPISATARVICVPAGVQLTEAAETVRRPA